STYWRDLPLLCHLWLRRRPPSRDGFRGQRECHCGPLHDHRQSGFEARSRSRFTSTDRNSPAHACQTEKRPVESRYHIKHRGYQTHKLLAHDNLVAIARIIVDVSFSEVLAIGLPLGVTA